MQNENSPVAPVRQQCATTARRRGCCRVTLGVSPIAMVEQDPFHRNVCGLSWVRKITRTRDTRIAKAAGTYHLDSSAEVTCIETTPMAPQSFSPERRQAPIAFTRAHAGLQFVGLNLIPFGLSLFVELANPLPVCLLQKALMFGGRLHRWRPAAAESPCAARLMARADLPQYSLGAKREPGSKLVRLRDSVRHTNAASV